MLAFGFDENARYPTPPHATSACVGGPGHRARRTRSGWPVHRRQISGVVLAAVLGLVVASFVPAEAQNAALLPEISRSTSQGEFVSAVGRRAALVGTAKGGFEGWVYPLKLLRDLHLKFHVGGQVLAGESVARSVTTRPESSTIVYSDASFQVRETLFVPIHEPGAVITFEVRSERPLEIEVAFTPDFQLEWPADIGPTHFSWDDSKHGVLLTAENNNYAAFVGSPTAQDIQSGDASAAGGERSLLLGMTGHGRDRKSLCITGSLAGAQDAAEICDRLLRDLDTLTGDAGEYYREYLEHTLNIDVPDRQIQRAYDWARINLLQGMVDNPLVGTGLVAGYGLSGPNARPGYDWFFGRDALWSSLALDAEQDYADTRTALELLAKYQRSDGKIPHEIPQSASLVPWFENYPYGYAAADATPLFLIAMNDYVERSGNISFAKEKWENISKAYRFLNSALDAEGFAQNMGVGHGWVESGLLVPVRTEIYEAALGIEALRAMENLSRVAGKNEEDGRSLEEKVERDKKLLNERFWSPEKRMFSFAFDEKSQRVDQSTVFPAVPMWFGLLDPSKADETIAHLAWPDMETDWGMRILSSLSPRYASEGYHFGSVWPLFTGWASVGEYRYHHDVDGYLNLRANALLELDGSPGHVTEVLAGDYYEPLETSTPQQTWSAAMIVAPLLEGLFGLQTNAAMNAISLAPHVPAEWGSFTISNLHAGSAWVTLRFHKSAEEISLEIMRTGNGKCTLDFSPAASLRARITGAMLNGRPIPYRVEANEFDQHASVRFDVPAGKSTLRIRVTDNFQFAIEPELPPMGSASHGLRMLSRSWTPQRDQLTIVVAGVAGNRYEVALANAEAVSSVEGAELDTTNPNGPMLVIRFPAGAEEYERRRIEIHFRPRRASKN